MKYTNLCLVAFLTLAVLVPPVDAQHRRRRGGRSGGAVAGAVLGVAAAIAANRALRDRYVAPFSTWSPYGGYGYVAPYGYAVPYGPRVVAPGYALPYRYGRVADLVPPGAYSYVDEGAYRNYRDIAGNYLGRVPLSALW